MRRTLVSILAASTVAALGCTDRSPTAPAMGTTSASSEAIQGRNPGPVARPRNVIVVRPRADNPLPPGVWGSDQASLTIRDGGAKLEILSEPGFPAGGCFGTYGEMGQRIPNGRFSLAGTYTQLMGVFPGRIEYAAQYAGVVDGNTMSITVMVPALQQAFGPFVLVNGVTHSWTPCLYP